jgi:CO/xanthine dehydrogenase FAD-binding subunit
MLPEFLSVRVNTKAEALSALSALENVKIIAGGTDLMVRMRRGETCAHIVDISDLSETRGIEGGGPVIIIGTGTTHRDVSTSRILNEHAPSLSRACSQVGSPQIRNMGTIGGNLVNASPAADSLAPLLIHDASLVLESQRGIREEKLDAFIVKPYKTSIRDDEMLSFIHIRPLKGYREGYKRVARRATWAISRLSVAWAIKEEDGCLRDVRVAIGSCTPMPFRAKAIEEFLMGRRVEDDVIREAIRMVVDEITRISGERPSFVYKLPVLKGMLHEALRG